MYSLFLSVSLTFSFSVSVSLCLFLSLSLSIYIYIYNLSNPSIKARWTPTYGRAKAGRPARTYIQQLCEDTGCNPEDLPEAMNDREKWQERVRDIRAGGTTLWWWWCILSLCHVVFHWEERNKEFPLHLRVWINRPPKTDRKKRNKECGSTSAGLSKKVKNVGQAICTP